MSRIRRFRFRATIGHFAILALALPGCRQPGPEPAPETQDAEATLLTFREGHMGTQFTIRLWAEPDRIEAGKQAARKAFAEIGRLERLFSDYRADSEIVRIAAAPAGKPVPISPDLSILMERALDLSRRTGGAFDVTLGPMTRLWRQSRKNHTLPTPERIADARARSSWQLLYLDREDRTLTFEKPRMQLDLGGIAKGFTADAAMKVLKRRGFSRSLVAASGDIAVGDPPPGCKAWRVGVRSLDVSEEPGDLTGAVELAGSAISTSGDTQQAVHIGDAQYSHIVDPKTSLGLTERIAVTVIGPDAATTDGYATAVSVMGKEKGLAFIESRPEVECLILFLDEDGEVTTLKSSGFPPVSEVDE
jgi:thiamine biosynthesis lipoprotein